MTTISDRIFERIRQLGITQTQFALEAGIKTSTISEWKKNRTNPSSDKILPICRTLKVSPEWLLSGVDPAASRKKYHEYYTVDIHTDLGVLIREYNDMTQSQRDRLMGYAAAFASLNKENSPAENNAGNNEK